MTYKPCRLEHCVTPHNLVEVAHQRSTCLVVRPAAYHPRLICHRLYLCRALAEEDVSGGAGAVAEAAGSDGQQLYQAGSAGASLSLDAYLTRQAGMYPDVAERLVRNHLSKDDTMSALITAEWYMRKKNFVGWGRPYEFNALLYQRLGRREEARDSVSDSYGSAMFPACPGAASSPSGRCRTADSCAVTVRAAVLS